MAKHYAAPPALQIDPNRPIRRRSRRPGRYCVELFAKQAPITVNNFVFWRAKAITTTQRSPRDQEFMVQAATDRYGRAIPAISQR